MKKAALVFVLISFMFSGLGLAVKKGAVVQKKEDIIQQNPPKKILVVYYAGSEKNKKVANDIALQLGADLEGLEDEKNRSGIWGLLTVYIDKYFKNKISIKKPVRDPRDYFFTVIGTPEWYGDVAPAIKTYLKTYNNDFNNCAYFATSVSDNSDRMTNLMVKASVRMSWASVNFTNNELNDSKIYDNKIKAFVSSLKYRLE